MLYFAFIVFISNGIKSSSRDDPTKIIITFYTNTLLNLVDTICSMVYITLVNDSFEMYLLVLSS